VYFFCSVVLHKNITIVYAGIMGGGEGGFGPVGWSIKFREHYYMILKAQAFSPIHGMAPHPPPSPFSLCVPPFLEPKVGGGHYSHAGEGGEPIQTTGEKAWHSVYSACP
jgi:hypothetical protein